MVLIAELETSLVGDCAVDFLALLLLVAVHSALLELLRLDLGLRRRRTWQLLSAKRLVLEQSTNTIRQWVAYLYIPLGSPQERYCSCDILICNSCVLL